jgi:GntR family transcriptional regulator
MTARVPGAALPDLARVEPDGLVPLYHRIKEALTLQIRSGAWRPGDEIPSELELCRHYGVSRWTLRQAISELVRQGLVSRRRGRGSFVSQPKLEGNVRGSYHQYLREGVPFDAHARILRCVRRVLGGDISRILRIPDQEDVYQLERIRFAQSTPLSLEDSYIPARLCPGLETKDLSDVYLYEVLRREYGAVFLRAEEYVEPAVADGYVAEHLRVSVGTPLFLIERHSYTLDDRVGEFRRAHVRGDLYRYRMDLR